LSVFEIVLAIALSSMTYFARI